ncbi:hypothetical protein SAMN06265795_11979 [Noviherbaspirillum humi]|uniref:Uncharacterized protein n=1 Tax=Noviherbaspirillum humi TaxID=1688639 RepID=A0A239L7I1_9BURK|nr:hypothetical protein [Noviherbaspirillum humi]SNT25813.1 hypothetical protein SAMN06265795_11979 [Noviherbaspirillum humi]
MCNFIPAFIPAEASLPRIGTHFKQANLGFRIFENQHMDAKLNDKWVKVCTTRGFCDCGSPLGSRQKPYDSNGEEKIAALVRKGWSGTRIKRYLE